MPDEQLIIRRSLRERLLVYGIAGMVYSIVFGTGGLLGLLIVQRTLHFSRQYRVLLVVIGIFWTAVLVSTHAYTTPIRYWLLYTLPLAGVAYATLTFLFHLNEWFLHISTWDHAIHLQEQRLERKRERTLARRLARSPQVDSDINLGTLVQPDARAHRLDGIHIHSDALWATDALLNQHVLLIGAPGSGKSEALKHLIAEVLSKTERDVFVVDGKGEREFTASIRRLFRLHRQLEVPMFQMGTSERGDAYNGFAGSPEAIKQRLTAMFHIEQQSGDSEFYANVNRAILNLVCLSPSGVPRSLSELDERLTLSWLKYCYRKDERRVRAIERYAPWFDGLRVRADSLIWDFSPYLSPSGFSLDSTHGAVFSLRTAALGDTSRRFLNFLIEDFKDWVGKRQQRPALLVIDEFGQFENQSIVALIELARSAQLGVILATQDLSIVREQYMRDRLLCSVQTKILMKTDTPETIGDLAGTYTTSHVTYQTGEADLTGLGSIRLEEERKVDLNRVRRFPPGRAYLIRSGVGVIIQFHQRADSYAL